MTTTEDSSCLRARQTNNGDMLDELTEEVGEETVEVKEASGSVSLGVLGVEGGGREEGGTIQA